MAFSAAATLLLFTAAPVRATAGPPQAGDTLPAFELEDLAGRPVSPANFPGTVVSVHFFAVWCEPCLAELPEIEKAASRYGSRGYQPLLVAVGHRQDPRRLRDFVRKRGLDIPVLYDARASVQSLFGVTALPTNLIVGRDGLVRWSSTSQPPDFLQEIGRLVEEKSP